tara:strand:- start:309 stop:602 length:294 start_codon:yes stop_codon:yes gene_type:complete
MLKELPECWYVVCTKQNQKTLSKWRWPNLENHLLPITHITGMYKWSEKVIKTEHNRIRDCGNWGIKISFDDFKRLVLKETPENYTFLIDKLNELNIR